MAGAIVARRGRRARRPLQLGRRDARPAIDDPHEHARPDRPRAHGHRVPAGVAGAFSSRLANARSSWAASACTSGRSGSSARLNVGRRRDVVDGGAQDLLDRAPVAARLDGLRLEAREVEQLVDEPRQPLRPRPRRRRRARGARRRRRARRRAARPAVRIAVSGVRRSCETARRSAVLSTSLRRSARVSTTSASSASRSSAAASSASSAGTTRSWTRPSVASGEACGQRRACAIWREPSRSGKHEPALVGLRLARARSRPTAAPSAVREALGRDVQRARAGRSPRSSVRDISAARSASRRRWSASSARLRAASASALATIAATRNTASATQFSPSAMVSRPVGGMWKKLNATAPRHAVAIASARAPVRRDEEHRQEVDDAQRDVGGDPLERVDDDGRGRDRAERDHDAEPEGRPVVAHRSRGYSAPRLALGQAAWRCCSRSA